MEINTGCGSVCVYMYTHAIVLAVGSVDGFQFKSGEVALNPEQARKIAAELTAQAARFEASQ